MLRMKWLTACLLTASMTSAALDGWCSPDPRATEPPARENRSAEPAPSGQAGGSEGKWDDLRRDPAVAGKLKEIAELEQKIEQIRKLVLPKVFEKHSKPYRERLEVLRKEVEDHARRRNEAVKPPVELPPNLADSARLLTPEQFDKWSRLIKPMPGESRWEEIPWLLSVYDARKKAAEEGKPIFLWSGGGAPPLGGC